MPQAFCSLCSTALSFLICQGRPSSWEKPSAGWAWTALCKNGWQRSWTGPTATASACEFVPVGKWESISSVIDARNWEETGDHLEQVNALLQPWTRQLQKTLAVVCHWNLWWSKCLMVLVNSLFEYKNNKQNYKKRKTNFQTQIHLLLNDALLEIYFLYLVFIQIELGWLFAQSYDKILDNKVFE